MEKARVRVAIDPGARDLTTTPELNECRYDQGDRGLLIGPHSDARVPGFGSILSRIQTEHNQASPRYRDAANLVMRCGFAQ